MRKNRQMTENKAKAKQLTEEQKLKIIDYSTRVHTLVDEFIVLLEGKTKDLDPYTRWSIVARTHVAAFQRFFGSALEFHQNGFPLAERDPKKK